MILDVVLLRFQLDIQVEMLTRQLEKESGAREEEVMCEDKRGRKQSVLEPAHSSL